MVSTPVPAEKDAIRYRPDIDGLRALAVLGVMLHHLDVPGFTGGFVGVDVFFVISGFLITRNIVARRGKGVFSYGEFYGRRMRRLFPMLFFILCASFVLSFLLLTPGDFADFAESVLYASVLAPNVFFWMQSGYFGPEAQFRPLLHLWSLGIEEQFYLLWPPLLIWLLPISKRTLCFLVLLVALASAGLAQHWTWVDAWAAFYLLPFRASGLAAGALVCLVEGKAFGSARVRAGAFWIGFGAIAVSVACFRPVMPYPGVAVLVPVLGATLVIGAARTSGAGRVLANPMMVRIGLASYSLYLLHWPILVFYRYWVFRALLPSERLAVGIVSLAAALAAWRWIEQPFRVGNRSRLSPPGFACACLALLVSMSFLAANVWALQGLPGRVPGYEDGRANGVAGGSFRCRKAGRRPGCVFGARKPTREDILVIGDSNARELFPAIDWLARRNGLKARGWTYLGCPPIFGVHVGRRFASARRFEAPCRDIVAQWERIVHQHRPAVVVLAADWALYTEPRNGLGSDGSPRNVLVDAETSVLDASSSREVLARQLPRTVAAITDLGSKVIVFGQPPLLGVTSTRCRSVPTYLLSERQRAERCRMVSYEQMTAPLAFADDVIARVATGRVMSVQMRDVFCDEVAQTCRFIRRGRVLYRDHNHLNEAGSLEVARRIESQFADFIRR